MLTCGLVRSNLALLMRNSVARIRGLSKNAASVTAEHALATEGCPPRCGTGCAGAEVVSTTALRVGQRHAVDVERLACGLVPVVARRLRPPSIDQVGAKLVRFPDLGERARPCVRVEEVPHPVGGVAE